MRRTAFLLAALVAAFPVPARAATPPPVTAWIVERTSPTASTVTVRGGASAGAGEYAFAAVASGTTNASGRIASAEGALFFGLTPDSYASARTPAGALDCGSVPGGRKVCTGFAMGAMGFAVMWTDAAFDRIVVVVGGDDADVDLGEDGSPGWTMRRLTGGVRVVDNADVVDVRTAAAYGAGAFAGTATAPGGARGSVAIAHPPCGLHSLAVAGAGVGLLSGGASPAPVTCPAAAPTASAATGATTWDLTGAAAGVSDVPVRLVVVDQTA